MRLKKIDKLILQAFTGRFFLTFSIVLFIFLTQFMIKNFKHFVGKGLGFEIYAELMFYFSLALTPVALPLGVLLSSLMTFGTLGEHSELTAIKGAGISLLRILWPVAFFVVLLTFGAFYFNDQLAPKANLKAYSLLYDIKQKKPVLEFKERVFYTDMPGYRIKVENKKGDGESLEGIMIYNHTDRKGNVQVIIAKEGKMKTIRDKYLQLDLKDGNIYSEESARKAGKQEDIEYFRNKFDSSRYIFSMESYGLKETKEEFFKGHNIMKTTTQLVSERDSMQDVYFGYMNNLHRSVLTYYEYFQKDVLRDDPRFNPKKKEEQEEELKDDLKNNDGKVSKAELKKDRVASKMTSYRQKDNTQDDKAKVQKKPELLQKATSVEVDTALLRELMEQEPTSIHLSKATAKANSMFNMINTNVERSKYQRRIINEYWIDIYRNFSRSVAVFVMFLIGAPLGAIIKKGGLGVPILVSVGFFVIYYISTIMGEKYAREMVIDTAVGCWLANGILFIFGVFFLRQARSDARLFDTDFYYVVFSNAKSALTRSFGGK